MTFGSTQLKIVIIDQAGHQAAGVQRMQSCKVLPSTCINLNFMKTRWTLTWKEEAAKRPCLRKQNHTALIHRHVPAKFGNLIATYRRARHVQTTGSLQNYKNCIKNVKIVDFNYYIWNHHGNCIQISTNMPGIG